VDTSLVLVILAVAIAFGAGAFFSGMWRRPNAGTVLVESGGSAVRKAVDQAEVAVEPVQPVLPPVPVRVEDETLPSEFMLSIEGPSPDGPQYLVMTRDGNGEDSQVPGVWRDGSTALVDMGISRLVEIVPALAQAVRSGCILEIVGPPQVMAGLKNHTFKILQNQKGDLLGITTKEGSTKFFKNLEFRKLRTYLGPAMAFQLMAIATGLYYLPKIDKQLAEILEGLEEILAKMRAEAWGKLRGAQKTLDEIDAQFQVVPNGGPRVPGRLNNAEQSINSIMAESELNVRRFADKVCKATNGGTSREQCERLLKEASDDMAADYGMFRESVRTWFCWSRLSLLNDAWEDPASVSVRETQMRLMVEQLGEVQKIVEDMAFELYLLAEKTVEPGWVVHHAIDLVRRRWESGFGDISGVTYENRAFLESARRTTNRLAGGCPKLELADGRQPMVYRLQSRADGSLALMVRELSVDPEVDAEAEG